MNCFLKLLNKNKKNKKESKNVMDEILKVVPVPRDGEKDKIVKGIYDDMYTVEKQVEKSKLSLREQRKLALVEIEKNKFKVIDTYISNTVLVESERIKASFVKGDKNVYVELPYNLANLFGLYSWDFGEINYSSPYYIYFYDKLFKSINKLTEDIIVGIKFNPQYYHVQVELIFEDVTKSITIKEFYEED